MQKESLARARSLILLIGMRFHKWTLFASSLNFLLLRGNVEEFFYFMQLQVPLHQLRLGRTPKAPAARLELVVSVNSGVSQNLGYPSGGPYKMRTTRTTVSGGRQYWGSPEITNLGRRLLLGRRAPKVG